MGSGHELVLGGHLVYHLPSVAGCLWTRWRFWILRVSDPSLNLTFRFADSYSGLNMLAFVMIFCFVPETKQRTLEELDYIFAVPLRTFIRYQFTKTLPWWFRRFVLRQKDIRLEPLYRFDDGVHEMGSIKGSGAAED